MSGLLTTLLEEIRIEYIERMRTNGFIEPYLTAERLCHERLFIDGDLLAEIIEQDPSLLAARAGELIMNQQENENPSVGIIICSNILAAALEGLLAVAAERDWVDVDDQGQILVDEEELQQNSQYPISVDYSTSETAKRNLFKGSSELSHIFAAAEAEFLDAIEQHVRNAYQTALDISSNHSVFAPDDIAPLVAENPLLLGLRKDDLIDEDLFEGDPPAGLIISAHLTRMLLQQMLELGAERGVFDMDSSGHIIPPDEPEDPPIIH